MKKIKIYILFITLINGWFTQNGNAVLFDGESRVNLDVSPPIFQKLSHSMLSVVLKSSLKFNSENNNYESKSHQKLANYLANKACNNVSFLEENTLTQCLGIKVAEDLVLTSNKCISNLSQCKNVYFIKDFSSLNPFKENFSADNVFECLRIFEVGKDYNLLKISQKSADFISNDKIDFNPDLSLISHSTWLGSSSGLPLKLDPGAVVESFDITKKQLNVRADSGAGSIGSALFTEDGSKLIALQSGGIEKDWIFNTSQSCYSAHNCIGNECKNEIFTMIEKLNFFTIEKPSVEDQSKWVRYNWSAETLHPYRDKDTFTQSLVIENAKWIRIFFKKIDTEAEFDFITITGKDKQQVIQVLDHMDENFYSLPIKGDRFQIDLVSDGGVNGYGFKIDYLEVIY